MVDVHDDVDAGQRLRVEGFAALRPGAQPLERVGSTEQQREDFVVGRDDGRARPIARTRSSAGTIRRPSRTGRSPSETTTRQQPAER